MRIISGTHGGQVISVNKGFNLRPTTDKSKETLFNILANKIDFSTIKVLELFAGTGNISYEFASRGAEKIISVDAHRKHCTFIKQTSQRLNMPQIQVVCSDAKKYILNCNEKFDIIFADPPYDFNLQNGLIKYIIENNILAPNGLLIWEHSSMLNLANEIFLSQKRVYGDTAFSFFKNNN